MLNQQELSQRVREEAMYIVSHSATVRETAKEFGVSKTTVHTDVAERLLHVDPNLYKKVRQIINFNISQRAIRGGETTRKKYKK